MKKIIFAILIVCAFFACNDKETPPVFTFKLTTNPSTTWEHISLVSGVVFFEERSEEGTISKSNLQQYNSIGVAHTLSGQKTKVLDTQPHWSMELVSIKPDFMEIWLTERGTNTNKKVTVPFTQGIPLPANTIILDNEQYEVAFILNPDQAFITENGIVKLNWDAVEVKIDKK